MPKISVIMSVYNNDQYLDEAIQSILNQTCSDFEFIITNDGSSDRSKEIIDRYAKLDNRIVKIDNVKNLGLTKSLNNMIDIAKGDFIARMDGDDISHSMRFEEQMKTFEQNKDVDIVFCNTFYIDRKGNEVCPSWRPRDTARIIKTMPLHCYIPHPTVILKKEIFSKHGKYNENYLIAQDWELWLRLIKEKSHFFFLKKTLLDYRLNPESVRGTSGDGVIENSYYYKLATLCAKNKCKLKAISYLMRVSFKHKILICLRILIPHAMLLYFLLLKRRFSKRSIIIKLHNQNEQFNG